MTHQQPSHTDRLRTQLKDVERDIRAARKKDATPRGPAWSALASLQNSKRMLLVELAAAEAAKPTERSDDDITDAELLEAGLAWIDAVRLNDPRAFEQIKARVNGQPLLELVE